MEDLDFNITIVGLGLIGGSFAMALRKLHPKNLWGVDIESAVLEKAEQMGIIDKGYVDAEVPLRSSDIVILALYPSLMETFIQQKNEFFKAGAIITDTAGIKGDLIQRIQGFLRKDVDFIGGHPMVGRESKGIEFAHKEMFENSNYILTPVKENKEENIAALEKILKGVGCKSVVRVTPKEHDEIIAYTSHLPHVVAVALMNSDVLPKETSLFIGGSFKDATRVADINTALWLELLHSNRENIINKIEGFERKIKELKNAIIEKNQSLMKEEFERAGVRRKELS